MGGGEKQECMTKKKEEKANTREILEEERKEI